MRVPLPVLRVCPATVRTGDDGAAEVRVRSAEVESAEVTPELGADVVTLEGQLD
jgi:hypothetical protein